MRDPNKLWVPHVLCSINRTVYSLSCAWKHT